MKNLLLALLIGLFAIASHAQQRCVSGVYVEVGLEPSYVSAHVNNDTLIVAVLGQRNMTGITTTWGTYGTTRANEIGTWYYMVGPWDGSNYRLSGAVRDGACAVTVHASCDSTGKINATLDSVTQTSTGAGWGFNCTKIYQDTVTAGQASSQYIRFF